MKSLIQNWKTTSAGLLLMIGAIVHLIFSKPIGEASIMTAVTAILGGIGLMAAGDAQGGNAIGNSSAGQAALLASQKQTQNQPSRQGADGISSGNQTQTTAGGTPALPGNINENKSS